MRFSTVAILSALTASVLAEPVPTPAPVARAVEERQRESPHPTSYDFLCFD